MKNNLSFYFINGTNQLAYLFSEEKKQRFNDFLYKVKLIVQ